MYSLSMSKSSRVSGLQARTRSVVVEAQNMSAHAPSVPAALAGTLSTRTDNDTGVITLTSGHGITTSHKPDIYFSDGVRYGVDVTATTGTTITIDAGSGTNLPALNAAVTVKVPNEETPTVTGNNVVAIQAYCPVRAVIKIQQANGTAIDTLILAAGELFEWFNDSAEANAVMAASPLAGVTVGKVIMSHEDATSARTVEYTMLYN